MPSTTSSSNSRPLASSTVMTPSLPTFSIASAIFSPTMVSPLAAMLPTWPISFDPETGLERALRSSTTLMTARSMPRLRSIGFMPAATDFTPSRTIAWASTVAVVVPSPAMSLVFEATSRTIWAPMFSNLSASSISLATVTPSLVMRGAPKLLSSTTLRPFGPRVTFTASARTSTPRSIRSRAFAPNLTSFAAMSPSPCPVRSGRSPQAARFAAVPPSRTPMTSDSFMMRSSSPPSRTSVPDHLPNRMRSPAFTSSGRSSPLSFGVPGPTAITSPSCGFSLAVSGTMMPPAVLSSASTRRTRTRSCRGRSFMPRSSPGSCRGSFTTRGPPSGEGDAARPRLGGLGQGQRQHAVLQPRLDPLAVDPVGQREGARPVPDAVLRVDRLQALVLRGVDPRLDAQHVVLQLDGDRLARDAGHLHGHGQRVLGLPHVRRRDVEAARHRPLLPRRRLPLLAHRELLLPLLLRHRSLRRSRDHPLARGLQPTWIVRGRSLAARGSS